MDIHIFRGHDHPHVKGVVVVIDVIRAFTTAAFAFGNGASSIRFVKSIEEAFSLKEAMPDLLLMGETEGNPIPGFDFENSPSEIAEAKISGRDLVQRTSSGTQGIVGCPQAEIILAASFVNAEATYAKIKELSPSSVSMIVTGRKNGDEDAALAEYLAAKLRGETPDPAPFLERVSSSPAAERTLERDREKVLDIDRFSFIIEVRNKIGRAVQIP